MAGKTENQQTVAKSGVRKRDIKRDIVRQTAYLPKAVHEQLRQLAFEERLKMHDYLIEGLDLVFAKRGLSSIQELMSTRMDK